MNTNHPKTLLTLIIFIALNVSSLFAQSRSTYSLTYTNKTPQLLTDAVCAVHKKNVKLFQVGTVASLGLAELAEDGDSTLLKNELKSTKGVRKVIVGDFLSKSKKTSLTFKARARDRITCVFGMLVVSNDAFPAIFSKKLPRSQAKKRGIRARVYDAGSEVNTESCDDVPGGPCNAHGVGMVEGGTIQPHTGLQGLGDLDVSEYNWNTVAVRGRISLVK